MLARVPQPAPAAVHGEAPSNEWHSAAYPRATARAHPAPVGRSGGLEEGVRRQGLQFAMPAVRIARPLPVGFHGASVHRNHGPDVRQFSSAMPTWDRSLFSVALSRRVTGSLSCALSFHMKGVEAKKLSEPYLPAFTTASSRWAISLAKRWCSLRRTLPRGSKRFGPWPLSAAWSPGRSGSNFLACRACFATFRKRRMCTYRKPATLRLRNRSGAAAPDDPPFGRPGCVVIPKSTQERIALLHVPMFEYDRKEKS